jgi:hypothetical protein
MKIFISVLSVSVFAASLLLLSILFSCSDNITDFTNTGFDSARFYWNYDTINSSSYYDGEMYTPDTSNIFIVSFDGKSIVRVSNGIKEFYYFSGGDYVYTMLGSDINNSYLFGVNRSAGLYKPLVWKWSGTGFNLISTNSSYNTNFVMFNGLFVSTNEIWIACSHGMILKFDGTNFQKTTYLDSLVVDGIFIDKSGKLKMLANHILFNEPVVVIYYIFEYQNNSWNKIYADSTVNQLYYVFNKEIGGFDERGILEFDGQSMHKVVDYYNMSYLVRIAGNSFNEFVGMGRGTDVPPGFLFHWNGVKWSKEVIGFECYETGLNRVNENFYVAYNSCGRTGLYIGRKK